MDSKLVLIAGGLIGGLFLCLFLIFSMAVGFLITDDSGEGQHFDISSFSNSSFDNSTPESTAVSIARLNMGENFEYVTVEDVYLSSDGKYWIVDFLVGDAEPYLFVTIDAKTLKSRVNYGEWRSLDELKASYIAEIQSLGNPWRKPHKITMDGKEIWKVPIVTDFYENGTDKTVTYIYVDVATGKSKNNLEDFNRAAGTDGWLTLKQVDELLTEQGWNYPEPSPFRDVLRDVYPE